MHRRGMRHLGVGGTAHTALLFFFWHAFLPWCALLTAGQRSAFARERSDGAKTFVFFKRPIRSVASA